MQHPHGLCRRDGTASPLGSDLLELLGHDGLSAGILPLLLRNGDALPLTLQEQRNFLLLWEKLTSSQKSAIEKLIEAMLEK